MTCKKNTVLKEEQRNELIVQHNHLIEAKYHLTLQEKRLMCWLASQVRSTDEDFKEHELSIKEFAALVEVKGDHLYKTLDTITHKLMQKIITIKSMNNSDFTKAALLGGVKYFKKKGIIKLSFHPYLKPYMLQVKEQYTKISLGDIIGLKSVYAIRIYELLKQYENLGERNILLTDLREYCGISEKQYKKFSHLKDRVINIARNEINRKTDLLISYQEVKTSRKVTSIHFRIKRNPDYGMTEFEKMQQEKAEVIRKELRSQNGLVDRIREYGFSRPIAKRFLQQETEGDIENALKAVNIQIEKGYVKNAKAMFHTAIQQKWKPDLYKIKKN